MNKRSLSKIITSTILIVIVILFGFIYIRNIKLISFFVDEYHFIKKSYYFDLFFVSRNTDDPRFTVEDDPLQPKIGPYIYGAALHIYGAKNIEEFLNTIHFNDKNTPSINWWEELWNRKFELFPDYMNDIVNLVLFVRKISVVFILLSLILIYIIAKRTAGTLFAAISILLVGTNVLTMFVGPLATTDSMLMFFSFLSVFLSLFLARVSDGKNNINLFILSFLLGFSVAMGVGVKISGILILFFVVLVYLCLFLVNWKKKLIIKTLFISLIITLVSFCSIFIFFHPYLYKDTIQRFSLIFLSRMEGTKLAQMQYPSTSVVSRIDALKIILKQTLLPKGDYTNFNNINFPVDMILFLSGFLLILRKSIIKINKNKALPAEIILVIWFIVMFVGLVMYLRTIWPRYFLECELIITIIESYAVAYIVNASTKRIMFFIRRLV